MTFGERVKKLRREFGLSQEALGAQGFVSTPGWIKIENSQRHASEKLIDNMLKWLVSDKYIKANASAPLREELLTLKYLGSNSAFMREMARDHARKSSNPTVLAAMEAVVSPKIKSKAVAARKTAPAKTAAAAKNKTKASAAKKRR